MCLTQETESAKEAGGRRPSDGVKPSRCEIALLTGGGDKPYALGLAFALLQKGRCFEFVGSDDLDVAELREQERVRFYNLRGDQNPKAGLARKAGRILEYYFRLIRFSFRSEARVFHLLWNNKFELFDRTLLMLYYRLLGKRVVMTIHNVNKAARDNCDHALNRWTLRLQYWLCDHLFVHTNRMKQELCEQFEVPPERIREIPFGINETVPATDLGVADAKARLGLGREEKSVLFFGNIAPYKGLEYLVEAMIALRAEDASYRLVIAGRPKGAEGYWEGIERRIDQGGLGGSTIRRIEYVPDEETEIYFKAADVLVLPYTQIFQSGVLFLGYHFGLPTIAADVGSLRDDIVEGETGLICRPADPEDLARALRDYFAGSLYADLTGQRPRIRRYAAEKYSWDRVGGITEEVYGAILAGSKG